MDSVRLPCPPVAVLAVLLAVVCAAPASAATERPLTGRVLVSMEPAPSGTAQAASTAAAID